MVNSITLNDGTFLYDKIGVYEYLSSLGFDIDDLFNMMCGGMVEEVQEANENAKYWEDRFIDYDYNMRTMYNEIKDLTDKLASGKGGTKMQYSHRIMNVINNYID